MAFCVLSTLWKVIEANMPCAINPLNQHVPTHLGVASIPSVTLACLALGWLCRLGFREIIMRLNLCNRRRKKKKQLRGALKLALESPSVKVRIQTCLHQSSSRHLPGALLDVKACFPFRLKYSRLCNYVLFLHFDLVSLLFNLWLWKGMLINAASASKAPRCLA